MKKFYYIHNILSSITTILLGICVFKFKTLHEGILALVLLSTCVVSFVYLSLRLSVVTKMYEKRKLSIRSILTIGVFIFVELTFVLFSTSSVFDLGKQSNYFGNLILFIPVIIILIASIIEEGYIYDEFLVCIRTNAILLSEIEEFKVIRQVSDAFRIKIKTKDGEIFKCSLIEKDFEKVKKLSKIKAI